MFSPIATIATGLIVSNRLADVPNSDPFRANQLLSGILCSNPAAQLVFNIRNTDQIADVLNENAELKKKLAAQQVAAPAAAGTATPATAPALTAPAAPPTAPPTAQPPTGPVTQSDLKGLVNSVTALTEAVTVYTQEQTKQLRALFDQLQRTGTVSGPPTP